MRINFEECSSLEFKTKYGVPEQNGGGSISGMGMVYARGGILMRVKPSEG